MASKTTAIHPLPRQGRTFAISIWILSLLLLAQLVTISYVMVSRIDWSAKSLASNGESSPVDKGEMSEEEILNYEASIIDSIPMKSSRLDLPPTAPPNVRPAPSTEAGYISDESVAAIVETGRILRNDGDMSGALEQFREADARLPGNPRILYEMASAYTAMGLTQKASKYWQQIWQLGAVASGDYYPIADLHLKGGANAGVPRRPETKLYVNQAFIKRHPEITDGEQVTVRVSIKATEGAKIDINKLFIDFPFFDLADGRSIVPTMADPPIQSWVTPPVDWEGQSEEILDMIYFFPRMTDEEIRTIGLREYYGFVVKLYYDDVLQDIYSHPRTLLDQIRRERESAGPRIEDSLFPSD